MKTPKFNPVGKAKISGDVPAKRIAAADAASASAPVSAFTQHINRALSLASKEAETAKKADAKMARARVPSTKDLERLTGPLVANVSLPTPKVRHPHLDTSVVQGGFGPTGDKTPSAPKVKGPNDPKEVRPDVGELTAGHLGAKTSYREPPKKPTPDRRGVPSLGLGAPKNYRWTSGSLSKAPGDRTLADLIPARARSGTSGVGSKPSRPPNFSTAGTKRANKPSTQSSSAGVAAQGALGKAGSEKRDIKDRNIETPAEKKNDSISRDMTSFLMEYVIKAPKNGVSRWTPKQGSFTPLRDLEPPEMPAPNPDANDPRMAAVPTAAKALGIDLAKGKLIQPSSRPKDKAAASKQLFGEDTMNPDKIANDIIREAFTSGDRKNVTTSANDMSGAGSLPRQMLSGEWFGSVAWPFDQPLSQDFAKSTELQADHAVAGQGELVGGGSAMESVGREIVDNLLEDSPSSIYSDVESVGYLINELQESGYTEQAATITSICENAKEEDVIKVVEMIEAFEAAQADPFLIEQLTKFAGLLIEEEEPATDENSPKEDAASETDDNKGGSEA